MIPGPTQLQANFAAAPLAVSGATPPQEPVGAQWVSSVGFQQGAARNDHIHQLLYWPTLIEVGTYLENAAGMTNGSFRMTEAQEYAVPFAVPYTMSFTSMAFWLGQLGSAGSVVRGGIRAFQPSALTTPGALVLDAGTNNTAINGNSGHSIAFVAPLTLGPGIWWGSMTTQGGAVTTAGVDYVSPGGPMVKVATTALTGGRLIQGVAQSGVTGALPPGFTSAGTTLDQATPYFALLRSA